MTKLIAALCFMFALSPLALAQDKGAAPKAAPAAPAAAPAAPAAAAPAAPAPEKKAAAASKAKKAPSEKQLAARAKMKSCTKDAGDQKLKGADRRKFMSNCLKG